MHAVVKFCEKNEVETTGKIPFDTAVTEVIVAGKTIVECSPENRVSQEIETAWKRALSVLDK